MTAKALERGRSCPICCDDLDGDSCSIAPWFARLLGRGNGEVKCKSCNNCFHSSCVDKWFCASGQRQCPLCRQHWDGVGAAGGEVESGSGGEVGVDSGRSRVSPRMMMTPRLGRVSLPASVNISEALSSDIEEYLRRQNFPPALSSGIEEGFLRSINVNLASDRVSQSSLPVGFDSQRRTRQYLQLDRVDSPTFGYVNSARDDRAQVRPMSSNARDPRQLSPLRSGSSLQPSHLRSWKPVEAVPSRDDRDLKPLGTTPRTGGAFSDAHDEAASSFNRPLRHPHQSVRDRKETIGIGYRQAIPPRRKLSPWTLDDPCPISNEWL